MAAKDLVWALAAVSYGPGTLFGTPKHPSAGSFQKICSVHSCSAKSCTAALCLMSLGTDTPLWTHAQGQVGQLGAGAHGGWPPADGAPLFRLPDVAPDRVVAAAEALFTVTPRSGLTFCSYRLGLQGQNSAAVFIRCCWVSGLWVAVITSCSGLLL